MSVDENIRARLLATASFFTHHWFVLQKRQMRYRELRSLPGRMRWHVNAVAKTFENPFFSEPRNTTVTIRDATNRGAQYCLGAGFFTTEHSVCVLMCSFSEINLCLQC